MRFDRSTNRMAAEAHTRFIKPYCIKQLVARDETCSLPNHQEIQFLNINKQIIV